MQVKHYATAGTLESSDIQISIAQGSSGVHIDLTSDVKKQFGTQIEDTIRGVLAQYGIDDAEVKAVDKGALDMVIRARALAACQRALDIADQPKWEVL